MHELRAVLDGLVNLVDQGAEDPEQRLEELLDELAWRTHGLPFDESRLSDAKPPGSSHQDWRERVLARFPDFGRYPGFPAFEADPEPCTMDAVDDVADILRDLEEVRWHWDHTSVDTALWHLDFGRRHHWGYHLRHLQVYLFRRRRAS